jgi:hypothetical protein
VSNLRLACMGDLQKEIAKGAGFDCIGAWEWCCILGVEVRPEHLFPCTSADPPMSPMRAVEIGEDHGIAAVFVSTGFPALEPDNTTPGHPHQIHTCSARVSCRIYGISDSYAVQEMD